MTAQLLTSQLNNLIQESKRKNAELRNAAENAVGELKGLPNTSESQLAGDLSRRPKFVKPFVLACKSSSGKTVGSGIICLQRLAVSQGLSRDTLKDVLEALDEATSQNADVQLKILQTLTAVVQNYGVEIRGDLIVKALWICSNLQASKTAVVSSTAAATLQQLVVAMFDKVAAEDG
ncbi:MAG: hypothetical protein M1826_001099 [Phylliscum demangeonii]|nr:MAG: hypothetical protein M1826_001099 [Phylliscum demangeonii]